MKTQVKTTEPQLFTKDTPLPCLVYLPASGKVVLALQITSDESFQGMSIREGFHNMNNDYEISDNYAYTAPFELFTGSVTLSND